MHCRHCKEKAQIYLKSYNLSLCNACFIGFFEKRVYATIDKFKMCTPAQNILVAVSGGKDSLSLWHVLEQLGYRTTGLYIDLGIGEYSQLSRQFVEKFAKANKLSLKIVTISDEMGCGMRKLARVSPKVPCSVCGMIKRYIMNREAKNYACIATGHNLDDEASVLLGNILNWQEGYLTRQYPVLEEDRTLNKRIKPLCLSLEQEISFYAFVSNIEYTSEGCPLSKGASTIFYKDILNRLEERMPAAKVGFYKGFIKKRRFNNNDDEKLMPCEVCGYLTTAKVCNFCRLKEKVK